MNELKITRKILSWSQHRMAVYLGVSQQYVSRMEKGDKPFTLKTLALIEKYLYDEKAYSGMDMPIFEEKVVNKLLKTKVPTGGENHDSTRDETFHVSNGKYTESEWEKWFWKDFNSLCKKCKNECRQSWQAKIVVCPQVSI